MTTAAPKVTVLAMSYNHSDYLLETLTSISQQTFQDFELLISDDASTDNSAALIQRWNDTNRRAVRLVLHKENRGLCATLNELLRHARGEYLQFIACDDHLLPRSLELKVDALDSAGSNVAAVYSDALLMGPDSQDWPEMFLSRTLKRKPIPTGSLYSQLLLGNFLPAMSVLSRRALVEEVGAFDEALVYEDWDLWLRLSQGYEFQYLNTPTVRYRLHEQNMHLQLAHDATQTYRILAKHRHLSRARMRIIRAISQHSGQFSMDASETQDFLSWADAYPETRMFKWCFFGRGRQTQKVLWRLVKAAESLTRPFTDVPVRASA